MKKILIFISISLSTSILVFGQLKDKNISQIYRFVYKDIKKQSKPYLIKKIYVSEQIYNPSNLLTMYKYDAILFGDSANKYNINIEQFTTQSEFELVPLSVKSMHLINEGDFWDKLEQGKTSIGICYFSNIAYYDNFATVYTIVQYWGGKRYTNFYFFKNDHKMKLVFSKLFCE